MWLCTQVGWLLIYITLLCIIMKYPTFVNEYRRFFIFFASILGTTPRRCSKKPCHSSYRTRRTRPEPSGFTPLPHREPSSSTNSTKSPRYNLLPSWRNLSTPNSWKTPEGESLQTDIDGSPPFRTDKTNDGIPGILTISDSIPFLHTQQQPP